MKLFSWLSERRDFIKMGLGIKARYNRCQKYWEHHLENCKEFQSAHLSSLPENAKVAVLGAGRLYDLPLGLRSRVDFFLYDNDPGLIPIWRMNGFKKNQYQIGDLTGSLESWTKELKLFLASEAKDVSKLSHFLSKLQIQAPPFPIIADAIISLNILSQLPVYWRDRVHALVKKYWKLDSDEHGRYEDELQQSLESSLQKLQDQHIHYILTASPKLLLIIYDKRFWYYESARPDWQLEQSLFINLEFPGYELVEQKSWLWDIAPQGVEQEEYGAVHEVEALALIRKK